MMERNGADLSVRRQSQLLGLNRSTCYYRKAGTLSSDMDLANEIHELWAQTPFYGYRRITAELKRHGHRVNGKRILRLMEEMNLQAIYPKPRTTVKAAGHKLYPYLLRELKPAYPNQVWETDITYLKLPIGFAYLACLIDVYSRYIVAWRLSNTMDAPFCLEMLDSGLAAERPEILNTDQGSQFTSAAWIERVEKAGTQVSMDGKGRWADNVTIERFWRTLKYEHFFLHSFGSLSQLRRSIGDYIEFYNTQRPHQSLGYKTPAEVYFLGCSKQGDLLALHPCESQTLGFAAGVHGELRVGNGG